MTNSMPITRVDRLAALGKAVGVSAALSLLAFAVLGLVGPMALSLLLGGESSLGGGLATAVWALFIVAPLCGVGFLLLSVALYQRRVPPNNSLERTRDR